MSDNAGMGGAAKVGVGFVVVVAVAKLLPAVDTALWVVVAGSWLVLAALVARPLRRLARPHYPLIHGVALRYTARARTAVAGMTTRRTAATRPATTRAKASV